VAAPEGPIAIAEALKANKTLTSINLSKNNLTRHGNDMSGITQIAEALKVNTTLQSIDIDGHPLLIMQLKGDEPAESIDLSGKRLEVGSAVIIASLIGSNSVTKSLSLSKNQLCGVNQVGYGTYTAEGITQVAEALKVNKTLQSIDVSWNNFRAEGAKIFAEMLKINTTLQSVDLRDNNLNNDSKRQLREAAPQVTFTF